MEEARQSENGNTVHLMKYWISAEKYAILICTESSNKILTVLPKSISLAQIQTQMYIIYIYIIYTVLQIVLQKVINT